MIALICIVTQNIEDLELTKYFEMVSAGARALPFMKASYSPTYMSPLVGLPPEMVERVYMYCTQGRLSIQEVRGLYTVGMLMGMEGLTDREIVHRAVEGVQQVICPARNPKAAAALSASGGAFLSGERLTSDDAKGAPRWS